MPGCLRIRSELTAVVANRTKIDRTTVGSVLDTLDQQLVTLVSNGDDLRWPGLLTLDVVDRPARTGHNPRTGETMEIAATKTVRIRAGSRLKSATQRGGPVRWAR